MTKESLESDWFELLREVLDGVPGDQRSSLQSVLEYLKKPTAVLGGVISPAGQRRGRVGGKLRTSDGLVQIDDALHVTPTTSEFAPFDAELSLEFGDNRRTQENAWSIVVDDDTDIETRAEALYELLLQEDANLPEFIITALENPSVDLSWQGTLAAASEQVKAFDAQQRVRLKQCLLVAARRLKASHILPEEIVWAAVRHYSSIIEANEAGSLLEFLAVGPGADTRQVALQAIQRIFEQTPPPDEAELTELSDRVFELARTYLQPDVLTFGANAALALNAVHALAVLNDPRVVEIATDVAKQDVRWFLEQVVRVLTGVRVSWATHRVYSAAISVVDRAIAVCSTRPAIPSAEVLS